MSGCGGGSRRVASGGVVTTAGGAMVFVVVGGCDVVVYGTNRRRNFLFRSVRRPEPSTLTKYWSNCRTSTTTPVRSHLRYSVPIWFCIRTWSPMRSGSRHFVCSESVSIARAWRRRNPSSRRLRTSTQTSEGEYLPGRMGMKSLMSL